jgi:3-oxoacyl-ACP reductase-like protein
MSDVQNPETEAPVTETETPAAPVVEEAAPPVPAEPAPAEPAAPPVDPDIVGSLEPNEMMMMNSLRQRAQQLTFELGNLELRKARTIAQIDGLEQQGQNVLNMVGKRLGLAEGQQWTLLQDGKVKLIKG